MLRKMTRMKIVMACLVLGFIGLTAFSLYRPEKAEANHACPHNVGFQLYGRDENCGYFLNSYVSATGSGLLTGIPDPWGSGALLGVNDVNGFVAVMAYHLQTYNGCIPDGSANSGRRRNSAAFIVLTMQGAPAGTVANGPCVTGYSFARWENLVRQYAARGLINFNEGHTYQFNTRIQNSTLDIAWYGQAWDTQPSIVVRAPNGSIIYAIKKNCANPVGIPGVLVPLDTPTTLQCGGITPPSVEAGETFTFSASFSSAGGSGPPVLYTMWVALGAAFPGEQIAALFAPMPRGGSGTGTLPNAIHPQSLSIATAGRYSGYYRVQATDATNSPITCPFTIDVVEKPYHRVYGGDVSAGAGFENSAGNCTPQQDATIIGWNRNANPFAGSGSQLAAFAMSIIVDFKSGQLRDATQGKHLTFANTNPSYSNFGAGTFGGGLIASAGTAVCAPNYFADIGTATNTLGASTAANLSQGIYRRNGSLTITGGTIGLGAGARTIYVDGNVTITNNITYTSSADPTFNGLNTMPSFRLIASGNIFVAPNVTQLDGIYIAQPRPGSPSNTGWFYTCYPGHIPTTADMNGVCRTNRLTVYGAVIADIIKLTRSRGTLRNSVSGERYDTALGNPAEVFIMTPEVWLTGGYVGIGEFDSVTSLPPVL